MGIFSRKEQHISVYQQLLDLGYSDEVIRNKAEEYVATRAFTVVTVDTPDGTPIVGLSYGGDYRAEEEYGVGEMMTAITGGTMREYAMTKNAGEHVAFFTDVNGLVLSVQPLVFGELAWGDVVVEKSTWSSEGYQASGTQPQRDGWAAEYVEHWDSALLYTQGSQGASLRWKSMPKLREVAKEIGLSPVPRKKDDLFAALAAHPDLPRERPHSWPGYFHYGKTLILRADTGLTADVLRILIATAKDGKLALGGGRQVFGSGLGLYDVRDEGPALKAARKAAADFYDTSMKQLEPVAATLKERGHGWYFLGDPRVIAPLGKEDEEPLLHFWLNGHGGYGKPQPSGWYTLEDLLAEKFVVDAQKKAAERAAHR